MARFRPTGLVQDISGSIGNLTFKTHRGMGIIQTKPRPRRQRTLAQRTRNRELGWAAIYWRETLTAAQRAAWNAYAKEHTLRFQTCRTVPMPGINAFIQHNIIHRMAGQGWQADPPAVAAILTPFTHAWAWDYPNRFSINWVYRPIPAETTILLQLSYGFPASHASPRIMFRQRWIQAGPKSDHGEYYIDAPFQSGLQARLYSRQVSDDGRFSQYVVYEKTWP